MKKILLVICLLCGLTMMAAEQTYYQQDFLHNFIFFIINILSTT